MDVEHDVFTLKQVQRLMALYSKAVEFYNGKSDSKYLYYQDKIQKLITKDNVLDMLNEKVVAEETAKNEAKSETEEIKKEQMKEKERKLKMSLRITNQETLNMGMKDKLIQEHTNATDVGSKIIESNMSAQTDSLQKRLEERRRKFGQKAVVPEGSPNLTSSSTPNQNTTDKKEQKSGDISKTISSGAASVEENWVFQLNLNNLADQGFSTELMGRLRLLEEGYDSNDYDDEKLFDEEAFEDEIDQILTKCDEEVETM